MSDQSATILSAALQLSEEEREQFASALWDSLRYEPADASVSDDDLLAETQLRRDEIRNGKVEAISHEELKRSLGR